MKICINLSFFFVIPSIVLFAGNDGEGNGDRGELRFMKFSVLELLLSLSLFALCSWETERKTHFRLRELD